VPAAAVAEQDERRRRLRSFGQPEHARYVAHPERALDDTAVDRFICPVHDRIKHNQEPER
jgi:hypothetical protein